MTLRTKLILLFTLCLLPGVFSLHAENITLNRARQTAEAFLAKRDPATRSAGRLTCINAGGATRVTEQLEYYYIFNREGGGFVIISALDAAKPVLGYSLEKSFSLDEEMPENLAAMLELYRYQIRERRASGIPATKEELARWDEEVSPRAASAP